MSYRSKKEDSRKYFVVVSGELHSDIIALLVEAKDRGEALRKVEDKYGDLTWVVKDPRKMRTVIVQDVDEEITEVKASEFYI